MFGAVLVLKSASLNCFIMCEDSRADQFHHGNATNRIGSTVTSLSGISLAGLLTFLWVMHLNIAYNNIFLWHGGKECVCGQPSYMRSPSYFATPSFKLCTYIIPSYPSWVFSNILRQRPSNCEING